MRRGLSALAVAAATVIGSQACATLTTAGITLVEIPISAAAKASDAGLVDAHTYELRVSVPAGDDWSSGDLLATAGGFGGGGPITFYNNPTGGNQPNSALWPFLPATEFDTFVTGPNFGSVTVLGRFNPPGGAGTEVFGPNETNVSWGDTINNSGGTTVTVARLTVKGFGIGTPFVVPFPVVGGAHVTGKLGSTADPLNSPTFDFYIAEIPEPTAVALMAAGVSSISLRRPRRARR